MKARYSFDMTTSPTTRAAGAQRSSAPRGRPELPLLDVSSQRPAPTLTKLDAENFAEWFAVLADPTRVRLLHALSTSTAGAMRIGDLAEAVGVSQSTCSHHVETLKRVGFVVVDKVGT